MLSVVDICNKALALINVSRIDSFTEESAQARICSTMYAPARDSLLREHPWGFARTCASLAVTDMTHPHWLYVYAIPSLYLYGISIFPAGDTTLFQEWISLNEVLPGAVKDYFPREPECRFEVSNIDNVRVVLTNVPSAMMEYIKQVTDVTMFDPTFAETLCYKLAADIAIPLTGDSRLAAFYAEKYIQALQHTKVLSANEGKHPLLPRTRESSFTRSRR